MQLDFFNDSHQVVLRNAAIDALLQADALALAHALQVLAAQYPDDFCVVPMQTLIEALQVTRTQAFVDHAALAHERTFLQPWRVRAAIATSRGFLRGC